MEIIFYSSIGIIGYVYVLFPILLIVRGVFFPKPYKQQNITPSVSLVIAAYNEAEIIEQKIVNSLELDYPRHQLQIIIASDGSSDGTNAIVSRHRDDGIHLLALPRRGKNAALNAAIEVAEGSIIVFSDANSMYSPNAIRALVRPFSDPEVGGVAGTQAYLKSNNAGVGDGESFYWKYDQKLKHLQSLGGNTTSATGAIYAIRRELFRNVVPGVADDNFVSIGVILQGYRLVYAPDAIAYENVADSGSNEFSRKVRVIQQGLTSILATKALLNPFRYGFYSLQLFTHKILRRCLFIPLITLLVSSLWLAKINELFLVAAVGQVTFYGLAVGGMFLEKKDLKRRRLTQNVIKGMMVPYYFCLVYGASMIAAFRVLSGKKLERWDTVARVDEAT